MIKELYMKNCALIEELRVDFGSKLNILTGETGSGKSIVLEGLNLCLGGKYDRSFLRKDCDRGLVELLIYTDNQKVEDLLNEYSIPYSDKELLVSRSIFEDGKSTTKLNGRSIRLADLRTIMMTIVDIHSQHQNQALYNRDVHLEFLDLYGKDSLKDIKSKYDASYKKYTDIKSKILELNDNMTERELEREVDLLKYQIDEIEKANLDVDEYEILKVKYKKYSNQDKINTAILTSYDLLKSGDLGVEDRIGKSLSALGPVADYDIVLEDFVEGLENIMYQLEDLDASMRSYIDKNEYNPQILEEIQLRMDFINTMKRKYGDKIEDILDYKIEMKQRLYNIENREERKLALLKEQEKIEEDLEKIGGELTSSRMKVANLLEESLLKELESLNMKNTKFKVIFNKVGYTSSGCDDVEYYVSFNLGENLNPLNKVASGGEMSRFMLAFKKILSDVDKIETMIFDEIDTGISGRAAQVVGEKLAEMAKHKQLICITHLPQIAAFADDHYYIEKNVENERTFTSIRNLSYQDRQEEIARLISGKIITEKTLEHSHEMIELAKKTKA
ncbi:DNA repair protein RecN [Peptostreptococcus stomatis DSM 17678]|uniref:DNA repair protein RecN n=1 Tax=Peptostreptococcus stomatis DSM 17678 TaxID=596315 RepID=E0E171_9FIRM|nr:DNA repair protein RecN [Peptostreptococcus stomatis]EFM65331.1 DNA repair protein RecN [Peptostreptococcus stomatis DSM 17678]